MPVVDISNVNYKLIGMCGIKGKERDILHDLWTRRFSEHTAFFTDAAPGDNSLKIARRIYDEVQACGFHTMAGLEVILVAFLDLTETPDPDFLRALSGVAGRLSNALGCAVRLKLTFGFIGAKAFADGEALCANAKVAAQADPYSNGLYLVAEPDFGGQEETRWKAVMVYLEMLRRDASVNQISLLGHENGTVGFLRYGEYDENLLERLREEQQQLTADLSENGYMEFTNKLNGKLTELEMGAAEAFPVNGAMQPIHPDMNVTGFLAVRRAQHGNHDEFNRARISTVNAVVDTGEKLEKQIMDYYRQQIGDPRECLIDLLRQAGAGIGFVENRDRAAGPLTQKLQTVSAPPNPILAYNPGGYVDEISNYLNGKFRYGVYKAKKWALEALYGAYMSLSETQMAKKRLEMQQRLDVVRMNMNHVPTKQAFCSLALGSGAGLEAQFSAFVGAAGDVTLKHLVCRKSADRDWINSNFVVTGPEARYFIHESYGGLGERDNAPIKAVQAALFECTDERLKELLIEE